MRKIIVISAALVATATSAHAQLLGGGLGGSLGGSLGGTLGGAGTIGSSMDRVGSATSGTLRGSGSTTGTQSVDRKSGHVHTSRNAEANGGGDLSQVVSAPRHSAGGTASGSGHASGSGSADAQLIGTDAVRGALGSARGAASGAASGAMAVGREAAGATAAGAGSLAASGSGAASGAGTAFDGAGNAAGSGSGALTVTKGTPVLAPDGDRIGKVRQVFAGPDGTVRQLLVNIDGQTVLLPANNFSASGNAVMSAMTEGQIKQAAEQQGSNAAAKPKAGDATPKSDGGTR